MIYAANNGHTEIVKLLITSDADVNIQGYYGITALIEAADNGYTEIVEMLISEGADVNVQTNFFGSTALIKVRFNITNRKFITKSFYKQRIFLYRLGNYTNRRCRIYQSG